MSQAKLLTLLSDFADRDVYNWGDEGCVSDGWVEIAINRGMHDTPGGSRCRDRN